MVQIRRDKSATKTCLKFCKVFKKIFLVSHQSCKDRSHLNYELMHYLYWRDCNSETTATNRRKVYARAV